MGWFSDVADVVMDFADSDFGSTVISGVADIGGDVIGAKLAGDANRDAAKTVARGYEAQANAIRQGNQLAQDRFNTIIEQGQPATDYLRTVVANDPYTLTPGQQTGRETVLRDARNRLASSGLRGAGRAGVAAINEADRGYYNHSVDRNMSRSDQAANLLSGRGTNAVMAGANADLNTGVRVAGTIPGAADAQAGADVANASLKGAVIGSLGSFIAQDAKDRSRESRYKNWKPDTV